MSYKSKGAKVQNVLCDDKDKKLPCVKGIKGQKTNFDVRFNFVEITNTSITFLLSWLAFVHKGHLNNGACVIRH